MSNFDLSENEAPDFELNEETFNEVCPLACLYHQEAVRCLNGKAFLAGRIMLGASLEALLLAFANCYPEEALKAASAPRVHGRVKRLIDWSLSNLVAVARELKWLPAGLSMDENWDRSKAQIGDYAVVINESRNLIHPSRYVQDWSHRRNTRSYLLNEFKFVDGIINYLLDKIGDSLRGAVEKQEANQ